jgi:hypothetical protein
MTHSFRNAGRYRPWKAHQGIYGIIVCFLIFKQNNWKLKNLHGIGVDLICKQLQKACQVIRVMLDKALIVAAAGTKLSWICT